MSMIITAVTAAYAKISGYGSVSSRNGHQRETIITKMSSKNSENKQQKTPTNYYFRMPLHYPRYSKADYKTMPEWKIDLLLIEYGLPIIGDVDDKRKFAMGAFLWPSQLDDH